MSVPILVSDVFWPGEIARLKGSLKSEVSVVDPSTAKDHLKDKEVWMIRSRSRVDRAALKIANRLRLIVSATSGFDHIDMKACEELGITVTHTPDANTESAAQLTMALILGLIRFVPAAHQAIHKRHWRDQVPRGTLLKDQTLGIVGLGRVGSRLAELVRPFGIKVCAFDPYQDKAVFEKMNIESVGFSEILRYADILSLHVPLTEETFHLLNHQTFHSMNSGMMIVNTSRGPVIEEAELCAALDEGIVKAAALDVFEHEPLSPQSRLKGRANVLLTPHIGAYTEEAVRAASKAAVDRVLQFYQGEVLKDCLPPTVGWYSQLGRFSFQER